jgi:hypothetical protein
MPHVGNDSRIAASRLCSVLEDLGGEDTYVDKIANKTTSNLHLSFISTPETGV